MKNVKTQESKSRRENAIAEHERIEIRKKLPRRSCTILQKPAKAPQYDGTFN